MKTTKLTVKTVDTATNNVSNIPQVISVPVLLEDVQHQAGMFSELPQGRYVLEYTGGNHIQMISVFWDGEGTVSAA